MIKEGRGRKERERERKKMSFASDIDRWMGGQTNFSGCVADTNLLSANFPRAECDVCLAVNIDRRHWVGLYIACDYVIYFDPLLLAPVPKHMQRFLKAQQKLYARSIVKAKRKVQSDKSILCGLFVTSFMKKVRDVESFSAFLRQFSAHKKRQNDKIVLKMLFCLK